MGAWNLPKEFNNARFITDGEYNFTEKHVSPKVMTFIKRFKVTKEIKKVTVYATAVGIYSIKLNSKKVSDTYFAPGFTSYKHYLQYQTYDITEQIKADNCIEISVAGGWAVGSYVMSRLNRISDDKQSLLLNICIEYANGEIENIGTDENFSVSVDGPFKLADFYDGETYDARLEYIEENRCHKAAGYTPKICPELIPQYGEEVRLHEYFEPEYLGEVNGERIYDFHQNFAGIVSLQAEADGNEEIVIKHAEILNPDGSLNTSFLRSAKATITYICKKGKNEYTPEFTYMGFRYISVKGIKADKLKITGRAIYSDIKESGEFRCSDERLNRFWQNILWSSKSNFVDIPTDCPQRDERLGWTGDISVFCKTAYKMFDMTKFLMKWLKDVKAEQGKGGGIPNTVPNQGYTFPTTMPLMAIDFWGDACVTIPWEIYLATGDTDVLSDMYVTMKKYVEACKFWASIGVGKYRYIWHTPSVFHFGDWVAPDEPMMSGWQKRSKWTATASLAITADILSKAAGVLGKSEDEQRYKKLFENVSESYRKVFFEDDLKLKKEFQTAYVLPIHFGMLNDKERKLAAANLCRLVKQNNYKIGTGFPGTPYILYALCDNGYEDEAFEMLFNDECPSWLYEVKLGATTIWERWDGLLPDGTCPIGKDGTGVMISYNHYASGAVGAFFYERILGIRAIEPAHKVFSVEPIIPKQLSYAEGSVYTPYGSIRVGWKKDNDKVKVSIDVPVGTKCLMKVNGKNEALAGGHHEVTMDK